MSSAPPPPELPRGIALAWGVAANPQRGPKREMTVERIVEAAIEVADAEGLGAVSMAAVAAKLGYTPMSLYRYVSAKDDLVLLMQETATGLPPESVHEVHGWRERLAAIFRAQVQVYLEHPWMIDVPISGSPVTPNSAAYLDAMVGAVAATPLNDEERVAVALQITGHSRWYGIVLAGYARTARESGMSPDEITAYEDNLFSTLITAEEFPALRRAVDAGVFRSSADPFAFGFERILDGIAAYIATLEAGGAHDTEVPWASEPDAEVLADKRVREARKAVRDAEKALRDARKIERQALADAAARAERSRRP
jgi:AcrR family transcriptional regulator